MEQSDIAQQLEKADQVYGGFDKWQDCDESSGCFESYSREAVEQQFESYLATGVLPDEVAIAMVTDINMQSRSQSQLQNTAVEMELGA